MGLSFSHAILSAAVLTCGLALKASVFDLLEPQLNGAQVLELLNNPNAAPKPDLTSIPATDFNCSQVSVAGYYADISTGCQVFHRCGKRGELNTYLCTAPTIFNQLTLVCDWWYQVNCERSVQLQDFTNSRLYLDIDVPLFDNPPPDYILQNFGQAAGNYVRNPYKNPYNRPRSTTLGGRTTSPAIRSGAPHRTKNRTTGSHSGRTPKSEEATDQFASDFPDVTDEVTTVSSSKSVHNPQITRYTVKQHTLKAQVTSNQKGGGVVTGPSLNGQNATQLSPRVDEEGNEILNEEGNEGGRQRNTPPANGSERGTSDGTAGGDDFDGTRDVDLETFATPRSVPSKSPSNTIRTALANQGRQTKSPKGTALGPKTEREGGNNVLTEASNGGSTDESELAESSITPNSANIPSGITLANGVRSQERPVSETPVKTTSKRPRRPTLRLDTQKDLRSCGRVKWFETMYENKRYIHEVIERVPMDHRLQVRTNGRCSTGSCSSCHTVCFNSFGNHKQNHKLTNGHWVAITAAASPCSGHENQTMEESKYGPKQAQDNHTAPA